MIGNLISATVLPKVVVGTVIAIAIQTGVIWFLSGKIDRLQAENASVSTLLDVANAAIAGYKEKTEAAAKRADAAEKVAAVAKAGSSRKVAAVQAVQPSGDVCADAQEMVRAYRGKP